MKRFISTIALAITALSVHAANAGPVSGNLILNGFQYAGAPSGKVTVNEPGFGGIDSTTTRAGGLNGTFSNLSGSSNWLLFCIELLVPSAAFGVPVEYALTSPAIGGLQEPFTSLQRSRLEKLFVKQVATTGQIADDAVTSAAVQLAVWEILHSDVGFGNLQLSNTNSQNTNGLWTASFNGARAEAESILFGLDSFNTTGWNVTLTSFNNGGFKDGKQDFLSAQVTSAVPEPSSLALILAGLFSMSMIVRKKLKP